MSKPVGRKGIPVLRNIIPAQPGWDVMEPCNGGMKANPIVAWEIVGEILPENQDTWHARRLRVVYPIIVDPWVYSPEVYVIRRPDGVFVRPGFEGTLENDAQVLSYFQEAMESPKEMDEIEESRVAEARAKAKVPRNESGGSGSSAVAQNQLELPLKN